MPNAELIKQHAMAALKAKGDVTNPRLKKIEQEMLRRMPREPVEVLQYRGEPIELAPQAPQDPTENPGLAKINEAPKFAGHMIGSELASE